MDRLLVWLGIGFLLLGLLMIGLGSLFGAVGVKGGRLLPGDVVISRPGFTFAFPVVTSIVLSILLTLILWLVTVFRR